jgi:hypothetical protein
MYWLIMQPDVIVSYHSKLTVGDTRLVSRKAQRFWDSLPENVRIRPEISSIRRKPFNFLFNLFISQENNYNNFLLQRALVRRCAVGVEKLVEVSQSMLSHVLEAISRRDFLGDYQLDLEYIHVAYGLPSASVLAVELLKQENERYQQQYTPYPTGGTQRPPKFLPRSETIQALSVFVSSLAYVDRTALATSASKKGRKFLKHVLDKILDPPLPPRLPNENNGAISQPASGEENGGFDLMAQFPVDDGYLEAPYTFESDSGFVQWLENMDWTPENEPLGSLPSMRWKTTFTAL